MATSGEFLWPLTVVGRLQGPPLMRAATANQAHLAVVKAGSLRCPVALKRPVAHDMIAHLFADAALRGLSGFHGILGRV